ncbi:glycine cleavage system protein H [Paenibacillus sp. HWE-109]|uniref:glycine cleavage system protein H n=1 Tax=Paenibacillus sp. HWE-109 TaxID=1306526 RepID=UPI001EDFE0C0|nr:glycine cleavage system protein H [Paenibacillus sp. HWE-109]UKS24798.1 glycine cleavage system protein H [Paenibacillus sp. HWE-109]
MSVPVNLKYTRDHFWIRQEGDRAVIGLTENGLEQLGMILYIELPERDAIVMQNEFIGSLETVDNEHDLNSPLSGKITAVNILLERASQLLNESPYDKGWLFAIQWSQASELERLWDANSYQAENPADY